jgi:hypothetical protein
MRRSLDRPKVGLVLSGGISKGLAFPGAIKALEEAGLKIDAVVGTSMGAVIGSFYAAGFSPDTLFSIKSEPSGTGILAGIRWNTLFLDIPEESMLDYNQQTAWGLDTPNNFIPRVNQGGMKSGHNIYRLLNTYLLPATAASGNCFDNLYVPFRAVATDILDAKPQNFEQGNLANTVRASLSFPGFFTPTFIDGKRYRDGGLMRNYPIESLETFTVCDPGNGSEKQGSDEQEKKKPKFDFVLGLDVSNTDTPSIGGQGVLSLISFLEAVHSFIEGMSATINRETFAASEGIYRKCETVEEFLQPCKNCRLLHTKIPVTGGFLEFTAEKVRELYIKGYQSTRNNLCKFFKMEENCDPSKIREAVLKRASDDKDENVRQRAADLASYFAGSALFSPEVAKDIDKQLAGRASGACPEDPKGRTCLAKEILTLSDQLGKVDMQQEARKWERSPGEGTCQNVLEGVKIVYRSSAERSVEIFYDGDEIPVPDKQIIRFLKWFRTALNDNAFPDMIPTYEDRPLFSSAEVVAAADGSITIKLYSWRYAINQFAFFSDLTEQGALCDASVTLWGNKDSFDEIRQSIKTEYSMKDEQGKSQEPWDNDATEKEAGSPWRLNIQSQKAAHCASDWKKVKKEGASSGTGSWKQEFHDFVSERPSSDIMDLATQLSWMTDRLHANGRSEYVRVEQIERDRLAVSEKTNVNKASYVYIFGDYQYDLENKHTFAGKISWYPCKLHTLTTLAVMNPAEDREGYHTGYYADTNVTYFKNTRGGWGGYKNFSITPYAAKRLINFASVEDSEPGRQLSYQDYGLRFVLGIDTGIGPPNAKWYGPQDQRLSTAPFFAAEAHRMSDFSSNDLPGVNATLHNLSTFEAQDIWKLQFGYRVYKIGWLEPAELTFTRVDASQTDPFWIAQIYERMLMPEPSIAATFQWGKIYEGGPHLPVDELFSLGGYYPLSDPKFTGDNRINFSGLQLNQKWGTQVFLLEYDLNIKPLSIQGMELINHNAKLQVDLILSYAGVSTGHLSSKDMDFGWGLRANAFLPVISTLQPKANFTVGGIPFNETSHDNYVIHFSVDIVF